MTTMPTVPPLASLPPGRRATAAAIAAAAGGAVGFGLGLASNPARAWGSLLVAGFYFLAPALGALFFLAMNHLLSAGWWVALRRIPEAMASTLPWMAIPLLLVFFGRHDLYHWTHPEAAHDPVLASKAGFLNTPFFFGRMLLILGIWTLFARWMRRLSSADDAAPSDGKRRLLVRLSGFFLVIFAVTFSLASFDWLMSLEPHWFSTIFAVYAFAGLFQGAVAAITVGVLLLRRPLERAGVLRRQHLHDLGKLLFAFSTFWAYIWLSQYLLIWYSHLPEEITHYVARTQGSWQSLFFLNLVLNWVIPFLLLMPRKAKEQPRVLLSVALIVLAGRWLDLYVHVMPAIGQGPGIDGPEVLVFVGLAGAFVYLVRRSLAAAELIPRRDPFLAESLTYRS